MRFSPTERAAMPDCDNWTTAMVLRWVLTLDRVAVLAMVDTYGAVRVDLEVGTVSRVVPEDIDAVMTAYNIDESLPPGEERTRTAVMRSERVIRAKEEIYRALRQGKLEARTRRNGTGDVEKIAHEQWPNLKFRSLNGHDIAVPVDTEQNVLDLRQPIEDYLVGRVPVDVCPAVWPDPLFSASQVLQIWPSDAAKEEAVASVEAVDQPTGRADKSVPANANIRPERPDGVSDREWQTYCSALDKGYDLNLFGSISNAARSIAHEGGHAGDFQSERRALTRVRKKIKEQCSFD
jgi:hypothetical protein